MSGHQRDPELNPSDELLPDDGEPGSTPPKVEPGEGAVHGGGSGVGIAAGTGAGTGGGGPSAGSIVSRPSDPATQPGAAHDAAEGDESPSP